MKYEFTVFTCTYNRADLLPRVYESLVNQTFTDFEWIIYDNGSTDTTNDLVKSWIAEEKLDIRLITAQENSGIQNAFNIGIKEAAGKFWLSLDSDDQCIPEALQVFTEKWAAIPEPDRKNYVGVTGNCIDQNGKLVGNEYPNDPLDSNAIELKLKHKVSGEKWGCMRTDILRQFPFPAHETLVMPGVVWNRIARQYQTRYFRDCLRIYYINENTRTDQITHGFRVDKEYCYGRRVNSMDTLNNDMNWFLHAPIEMTKQAIIYTCFSILQPLSIGQTLRELTSFRASLLAIAVYPLGFLYSRFGN